MLEETKFEEIKVQYLNEKQVAIVSLNRAKKYNALTFEMFDQFRLVFERLDRNESDVRAIVFTDEGKHFTKGIDIK